MQVQAIATGLSPAQLQELTRLIARELERPWQPARGRPRALPLGTAVIVTCLTLRHNTVQEFLAALTGTSQPTISRIITQLTPLVARVLDKYVPDPHQAQQAAAGQVLLIDGTLTPCWSYRACPELWSGKTKTTGFNVQVVSDLAGHPIYIAEPLPGSTCDLAAYRNTGISTITAASAGALADKGYHSSDLITPRKRAWGGGTLSPRDIECNTAHSRLRAPIERCIAWFKTWRILHTDYRRPYTTYHDTFNAVRALFFFTRTSE